MMSENINWQMLDKIDWKKGELVPVIAQDDCTNEVLMLAYMNKEALKLTLETKEAHYFSRSKERIWKKGESSGHIQKVKDILLDCDNDTILMKIDQEGVACHTGRKSCFFTRLESSEIISEATVEAGSMYNVIDVLYHTILERVDADPSSSYTAKLLHGKQNSMLKKIVEEAGELCFAVKDDNKEEIIYEMADLLYHSLVALASKDINPDLVMQELKRRFSISGIEEKNNRSK
jgi:phosphoribosyl-ATP pyrophosphohydrolase/phosphoribosyl-AMP cyclohydrolase